MNNEYQSESFLGSGRLLVDVFDDSGVSQGYLDVGNAKVFSISGVSADKKEMISMRSENYGQVSDSVMIKISRSLKFTLTDINRKNLALALMGSDAGWTQAGGNNVGAHEHVTAHLDRWSRLAGVNLDTETPPVVKASGGGTTYDEYDPTDGTGDYIIDYAYGLIKPLTSGAITEAEVLEVESTWLAIANGFEVEGDALTKLEGRILLCGVDLAGNRVVEVAIPKANLTPSGDINWISTEFAELSFEGEIQWDQATNGTHTVRHLAGVSPVVL
jgi:hypothetical protein